MSTQPAAAPPPKLSRGKKLLFTLILFLVIGLVFELALRVLKPELFELAMVERRTHVYREWCARDLVPNASAHYLKSRGDGSLALDYFLETDEHGLRRSNPGTPLETTFEGKPRTVVHCLGDSMTMGWGVKPEESYPEQLQGLMGDPYLVLNLGVDGIGVRDATERSRRLAATYPPEVSILMPFKNDPGEDQGDVKHDRRSSFGHAMGSFTDSVVRNLYLAQVPVVIKMMRRGGGDLDVPLEVMIDYIGPDMTPETWQTLSRGTMMPRGPSVDALQAYADECAAAGRPLLVIFAHGNMFAYSLGRYCREKNIPYLAMPIGFSGHLKTDLHLNADGCRQLAQAVHLALMTGEGVTGPWQPLP
jgi:lysophospholipase L1-like esterase